MRRALLIAALLLVLTIAPSALAARTSWAQNEIETVVAAGLMAPSPAEFRPNDALTTAELAELTAMLGGTVGVAADPTRPVQVKELDAVLVRLFKLGPVAKHVRSALVAAGLKPPAYAGTEVVARLLGLRLNHPEALDAIELGPRDAVTRAETAYSVARVLALRAAGNARDIAAPAAALQLPELSDWQRRVLTRAVRFVGYPYIWGGSSERRQAPFGRDVPGGFDCSGFVWRVYKLEPFADAPGLAETLQGRTTYAMSGEVAPAERIALRRRPGRRRPLLRRQGPEVEAVPGRPHGSFSRQRLDDSLVEPRRDDSAARGLVCRSLRLGPPAARRGRACRILNHPDRGLRITHPGDATRRGRGDTGLTSVLPRGCRDHATTSPPCG